jgi:hypothetical protein
MYMKVLISHSGGEIAAFEEFEDDAVVGYVAPDGSPVDLSALEDVRLSYVSREVLESLPA